MYGLADDDMTDLDRCIPVWIRMVCNTFDEYFLNQLSVTTQISVPHSL